MLAAVSIGLALASGAEADEYGGIEFPQGAASFADGVLAYTPDFGGGPVPTDPNFLDPSKALGVPDYSGGFDGTGAVAAGSGGLLELLFTDNVVTNSGNSGDDLAVFEVGVDEALFVALRPNASTFAALGALCTEGGQPSIAGGYCELGSSSGGTSTFDLDALFPGFAPGQLRFDAVQLIDDDSTGHSAADQAGADFDAVGAISSGSVVCGDGQVEGSEACDDGGVANGDGCTATCQVETCYTCSGEPSSCQPAPGAACDDGEPCTENDGCVGTVCVGGPPPSCDDDKVCTDDSCIPGAGCNHASNTGPCDDGSSCSTNDQCSGGACLGNAVEATGCRLTTASSPLRMRDRADDALDFVIWKWPNGPETMVQDFGDPEAGGGKLELCVFDRPGGAPRLRAGAHAPKGGQCGSQACWKMKGDAGYLYKNLQATFGTKTMRLKPGPAGKAKIVVKARGEGLLLNPLNLALPVKVQLKDTDTGECWEANYANPVANDATRFKATE